MFFPLFISSMDPKAMFFTSGAKKIQEHSQVWRARRGEDRQEPLTQTLTVFSTPNLIAPNDWRGGPNAHIVTRGRFYDMAIDLRSTKTYI